MQVLRHPEATSDPKDPRNNEVVNPGADIFDGNLSTPINSSPLIRSYINTLPAYREGISPQRRGLEIGFFHGIWLILPFTYLGPLRDTPLAELAGLLSSLGLLLISALSISLYGASKPPAPTATITTPNPPKELATGHGWNEYAGGFLIGGGIGSILVYFLLTNLSLFDRFGTGL
jgi:photosystem I subunit XI